MPVISLVEQDNRRKHIINSARELFFTKGFIATSMEDIAKHAGLHRRTLYGYFAGKEELYFVVLNQLQKDKVEYIINEVEQHSGEYDRLYAMGMSFYNYFKVNIEVLRFQLYLDYADLSWHSLSEITFKEYKSYNEKVINLLKETIQKGIQKGIFKPDLQIETYLSSFFFASRAILNRCLLQSANTAFLSDGSNSPEEYYKNFITIHIKGIMK